MSRLFHLRRAGAAALVALSMSHAPVSFAVDRCEEVLSRFADRVADATCTESADLTTANPATTPVNDAIAVLPHFAFTPRTDRDTIAPDPSLRTPIAGPVPGVQIEARIAGDPQGQARVLMRLPDNWNGRLVVAGASGTRSEFNGDFVWSDYLTQKGYAYVSQNKGTLNLTVSTAADSLAGRLSPSSTTFVHFYDDDPGMPFTRWATFMAGGGAARAGRSRGPLWPGIHLCGRHLERRLSGAACRRVVRWRRRLGRHFRRRGHAESLEHSDGTGQARPGEPVQ
jgi:hypothetical protein